VKVEGGWGRAWEAREGGDGGGQIHARTEGEVSTINLYNFTHPHANYIW